MMINFSQKALQGHLTHKMIKKTLVIVLILVLSTLVFVQLCADTNPLVNVTMLPVSSLVTVLSLKLIGRNPIAFQYPDNLNFAINDESRIYLTYYRV